MYFQHLNALRCFKISDSIESMDEMSISYKPSYTPSDFAFVEVWYKNGIIHRDDFPAVKFVANNGNPGGELHSEIYYSNGKIHRTYGPAVKIYYANSKRVKEEVYIKNGLVHSDYGPAVFRYFKTAFWREDEYGYIKEVVYFNNGVLERTDGPAWIEYFIGPPFTNTQYYSYGPIDQITYHLNGEVYKKSDYAVTSFHKNGNLKNKSHYKDETDLPSEIRYHNNGVISKEIYTNDSYNFHRNNGPALKSYRDDGSVEYEIFYRNGQKHNELGPAHIKYDLNNMPDMKYYLFDKQVSKRSFEKKMLTKLYW